MTEKSFLVKIVLVGDEGVGKTTLLRLYANTAFQRSYKEIVGADFAVKTVNLGRREVRFQIWELAEQPRFQTTRKTLYHGTMGGVLMFDVTCRESFLSLPHWLDELWQFLGKGHIPVVLVGNKIDLQTEGRDFITREEAEKYVQEESEGIQESGFPIPYFEISVKTGEMVEEVFHTLGTTILAFEDAQSKGDSKFMRWDDPKFVRWET